MEVRDLIVDINSIPVEVLRQALDDTGYSASQAAELLGWGHDTTRVRRILGYVPDKKGRELRTHVPYDRAVELIRAWNLDPVDYGV